MKANDCNENETQSKCRSLVVDNTKYRTFLTKKFENRKKWEKFNPKKILAFIPGTIVKVNVKKGQKVKKGEQLLILDAMKMKNIILSSLNGTVKSIEVKEGQKVPKGFLMVELT